MAGGLSLRDQPTVAEHRAFVGSLVREGVVTEAGPFAALDGEPGDLVGLIVFSDADLETAARLMAGDPGIRRRARGRGPAWHR